MNTPTQNATEHVSASAPAPSPSPAQLHLEVTEAELLARFFRVLGDPTRVRLMQLLLEAPRGECTVGELVDTLAAPQSRVSTHLGCLRWCGLVRSRRAGKQVYYRVADPRVCDLLMMGGSLLREHAAGVASCGVIR